MLSELSIVIPTYNESGNIGPLLSQLRGALSRLSYEIIFVDDDSPDGTADVVRRESLADPRIRCLKRVGRRGLSSACIEGMRSSSAHFFVIMDADLQHDPALIPVMLDKIRKDDLDIVIGSRYVGGAQMQGWSFERRIASRAATALAQLFVGLNVKDPMSGFFLLKREYFCKCVHNLNGQGFKILLDLLASSPTRPKVAELPYTFRSRKNGKSKLGATVVIHYFMLILDKVDRRCRWFRYGMVLLLLTIPVFLFAYFMSRG